MAYVFKRGIVFALISVFICVTLVGASPIIKDNEKSETNVTVYKEQNLDYTDKLKTLDNPERGFYVPTYMVLSNSNNHGIKPKDNLVHLRIDLSAFSSNAKLGDDSYGISQDLSEDALNAIDDTLNNIKKAGHTVIIRCSYDHNFEGNANCEPSQEQILKHLEQLSTVYTKYKDVILYVELGIFGPWGEMHTSKCCNKANVTEAINTLLDNTPKDLLVGVRTPAYVAGWLGISESKFKVNGSVFQSAMKDKGIDAIRVGMFDDGYLGSKSDLGTYGTITRKKGVDWLNVIAQKTPFGGEVTADSSGKIVKHVIGNYNTFSFIANEGFKTHTSYLNIEWNNKVLNYWKKQSYEKQSDEYNGQNGLKYVKDHLGYRFVLRKSELSESVKVNILHVGFTIDNVGFGNVVKNKVATIVLKDTNNKYYEFKFNECVVSNLLSSKSNVVQEDINLPENLPAGEYSVYLRFSQYGALTTDDNYNCIKVANDSKYWNSEIGANYVGSVIKS